MFQLDLSLRSLKRLLIQSPLYKLSAGMTAGLLPIAYSFKFAQWFHESDVSHRLLHLDSEFEYDNRYALYGALAEEFSLDREPIQYLEFGVATGCSLRWWTDHSSNSSSRFVGFDTFDGLPERWGRFPQGAFATGGEVPEIQDSRCSFRKGLFHETLPPFLQGLPESSARSVIHMDADLYGSTLFVLVTLAPRLKPGDLLIFDEFADVMNEFRALLDLGRSFPLKLRLIRAVNWGGNIALAVE